MMLSLTVFPGARVVDALHDVDVVAADVLVDDRLDFAVGEGHFLRFPHDGFGGSVLFPDELHELTLDAAREQLARIAGDQGELSTGQDGGSAGWSSRFPGRSNAPRGKRQAVGITPAGLREVGG
jgi:hypothetical protein